MKLRNFFLPHPDTHKRAHLISVQAFIVYIILFIFLQFGLGFIAKYKPEVLGISSNVSVSEIISLVNSQRQKNGLGALSEDSRLDLAASAKAQNMFEENYWAHYSPSGKDPWGFIQGAGYKFTFAGENLAKNFYNATDVVNAWMASSTHRDNILNSHYQNIGIAVAEGILNGQPTVLIVQELGSPVESLAQAPVESREFRIQSSENTTVSAPVGSLLPLPVQVPNSNQTLVAGQESTVRGLLDPYLLTKNIGLGLIGALFLLIALDYFVMHRRKVVRLASSNFSHLALLSIAASYLFNISRGSIL